MPWELYRAYGDTQILAELWPTMVAWLDRAELMAATGRHPARVARRPSRRRTRSTCGTPGFTGGSGWNRAVGPVPTSARSSRRTRATWRRPTSRTAPALMARIARVLGRDDDAARYAELADQVRAAWQAEYIGADGRLTPDTQANHVRALAFDLVPAELAGRRSPTGWSS